MAIQPLGTLVFTIVAGIFALILGSKTRFPSILFLLIFGVLLGPHFFNVVEPDLFLARFPEYISILVALILFEGGASLKFSQFHDISRTLRRLLTLGVLVTLVLASLAIFAVTNLGWVKSILFGSIMIVTGPTVVLPILQRIRAKENLHNILKWEAILIDPIGVVTAIVLFEFLLADHANVMHGLMGFGGRLVIGSVVGLVAGWIMFKALTKRWLLRLEGEEFGGLFVLACTLLFYALAEWILPEAGLVAATVAGIYLGNQKFALQDQVFHFKQQITSIALSGLFILLSANVPVEKLQSIWIEGTVLLAILIFLVRPAAVFISAWGDTKMSVRDKLFLSFLAPRGIVSASLASIFALAFEEKALGSQGVFLPLAFYVISGSIVFYAVFAGLLVKLLKVGEEKGRTILIVGANRLGLIYGQQLRECGMPVTFIDTNPRFCADARNERFEAFNGSGFDREFLESLDLKGIHRMVALTPNHEVNVLSCQAISRYLSKGQVFRLWDKSDVWENVVAPSYDDSRGRPLFTASSHNLTELWQWLESSSVSVQSVKLKETSVITPETFNPWQDSMPLFVFSEGKVIFPTPKTSLPKGGMLYFLTHASEPVGQGI